MSLGKSGRMRQRMDSNDVGAIETIFPRRRSKVADHAHANYPFAHWDCVLNAKWALAQTNRYFSAYRLVLHWLNIHAFIYSYSCTIIIAIMHKQERKCSHNGTHKIYNSIVSGKKVHKRANLQR